MGDTYKFFTTKNYEILFRWLRVCITSRYEPIIPSALEFVTTQCRFKFVEPIYKGLFRWKGAKEIALKNFEENKDNMNSITVKKIERMYNRLQQLGPGEGSGHNQQYYL